MRAWRISLAVAGLGLGLYGAGQLLTQVSTRGLVSLGVWMVAAVLIHDGLLSPLVVSVGWTLRRTIPDRARRYVQAALIMASLVTVIAVPMIYREDTQPAIKAILLQDYGGNLTLLLTLIGGVSLVAYAVRVARDHQGPNLSAPPRPEDAA